MSFVGGRWSFGSCLFRGLLRVWRNFDSGCGGPPLFLFLLDFVVELTFTFLQHELFTADGFNHGECGVGFFKSLHESCWNGETSQSQDT